jgi:microcystin-dependent protein
MDEVYIGSIHLFAFPYAPMGFALCNGATLQIMQYQALFALINNKFGGDGKTNFMLPNLLNASPFPAQNMQYYIATQGMFPTQQ